MRPSTIPPTRVSHIPSSSQPPNPALLVRLAEKKKEFEAVDALQRSSSLFLKRLEGLADDCEVMAEAGIVHGQVLAQWPQMFRILNTFLAAREASTTTGEEGADPDASFLPPGGRLVRVPIDELQHAEQKQ
ncbi:hypothetical protein B0F90DRAFT_1822877 [Multifurca ochricompacta]|uniref:DASH complex subunit DAD2 n=1 Tax=Multifurca ochricompacta TaxID=376703 RepID=A0AAD4LW76_9AGAM|nr:hypothetical protein B0F90DRAFT_1822877 [Multifurca ochricompacta]